MGPTNAPSASAARNHLDMQNPPPDAAARENPTTGAIHLSVSPTEPGTPIRPEPSETVPFLPPPLPSYNASSSDDDEEDSQPYILIPSSPILRRRRRRRRTNPCCTSCAYILFTFFSTLLFFTLIAAPPVLLFPYDPTVEVTNLRLTRLRVSPPPRASFDLTLKLDLYLKNSDLYALDYRSVVSSVSYRGRHLGSVNTTGGRVKAWGGSNLEVELRLDGARVEEDELVYLIEEDLTKGSVPLETVTEVEGSVRLIFFEIPVKGNTSCTLNVNPRTQKIVRQNCNPQILNSSIPEGT